MNDKKNLMRLYDYIKSSHLVDNIRIEQNLTNTIHALAVQQLYDRDIWLSLFRNLLALDMSRESRNVIMHRALIIALELFEMDHPQMDPEMREVFLRCKAVTRPEICEQDMWIDVSRGSKFYIMLLQELGYKEIQSEMKVANILQCDIYVKDIDMVVEIQGPAHYKNMTTELIDSSLYVHRIYRKYHKHFLSIPYDYYDSFLSYGTDQDLKQNAQFLKRLIDNEVNKH